MPSAGNQVNPSGATAPRSLTDALRAVILEALQLRGSVLMTEAIAWLAPSGYSVEEIREAVNALLRAGSIDARPWCIRTPENEHAPEFSDLELDVELRKKGLPQ